MAAGVKLLEGAVTYISGCCRPASNQ